MERIAAASETGIRKQVNEDSCCIKVAQTSLGELVMAVVCDGVGGLSAGNVASATVVTRFAQWFEEELPCFTGGGSHALDLAHIRSSWETLLQEQNDLIRSYGEKTGTRLGTTFTGIIACAGRYLVGHVGDCRAYLLSNAGLAQLTEDQTKAARMLAAGEILAEQAAAMPKNVIWQAVGSVPLLAPAFYEGSYAESDLFIICCDGAYHRASNEGIRALFTPVAAADESALAQACQDLLTQDMAAGEKDNLTVACFAMGEGVVASDDDLPTMVEQQSVSASEDDLPTQVEGAAADEDNLPTMVELQPELGAPSDEAAPRKSAAGQTAKDGVDTAFCTTRSIMLIDCDAALLKEVSA